jgi:hypothetical protein
MSTPGPLIIELEKVLEFDDLKQGTLYYKYNGNTSLDALGVFSDYAKEIEGEKKSKLFFDLTVPRDNSIDVNSANHITDNMMSDLNIYRFKQSPPPRQEAKNQEESEILQENANPENPEEIVAKPVRTSVFQ